MTILHRRRSAPVAPDVSALADAAFARDESARQLLGSIRTVKNALGGTLAGLVAGTIAPLVGLAQVQPLAAAFAGLTATIAVKLRRDQVERSAPWVLNTPGGRGLVDRLLAKLDEGQVALRKGSAWVVFDRAVETPRVMSDEEYKVFVPMVPNLVEVEASREGLFVSRFTHGDPDSVLTGLPTLEAFDRAGVRVAEQWWVRGEKADKEAVMRARALSEPEPTYAEQAFEPRI